MFIWFLSMMTILNNSFWNIRKHHFIFSENYHFFCFLYFSKKKKKKKSNTFSLLSLFFKIKNTYAWLSFWKLEQYHFDCSLKIVLLKKLCFWYSIFPNKNTRNLVFSKWFTKLDTFFCLIMSNVTAGH